MASISGEEAAITTRRLTSTVWHDYTINRPADGGAPTATCLECGLTLCAGGNNGTSHLRRHSKSKRCQQRAAELCAASSRSTSPTTAAEPSPGDDDYYSPSPPVVVEGEEKDRFTVDGIYIPELYDKLIAEGLDNIDQSRESAEHFSAASNYVPAVPQAPSSSTRWFNDKRKERQLKRQKTRSDARPMMNPACTTRFQLERKEDVSLGWHAAAAAATIQDYSHHASNKQ